MSITLDGIKYKTGNRSGHIFMSPCDRCGKFQMELVDLRSKNPSGIQPIYGLQCKACKTLHIGNAELQRRGPELFNSPPKVHKSKDIVKRAVEADSKRENKGMANKFREVVEFVLGENSPFILTILAPTVYMFVGFLTFWVWNWVWWFFFYVSPVGYGWAMGEANGGRKIRTVLSVIMSALMFIIGAALTFDTNGWFLYARIIFALTLISSVLSIWLLSE